MAHYQASAELNDTWMRKFNLIHVVEVQVCWSIDGFKSCRMVGLKDWTRAIQHLASSSCSTLCPSCRLIFTVTNSMSHFRLNNWFQAYFCSCTFFLHETATTI